MMVHTSIHMYLSFAKKNVQPAPLATLSLHFQLENILYQPDIKKIHQLSHGFIT
ncbi:hypothetical protein PVAP13_3KG123027 [Panicum virgatum]|uniref:Uncharacterized protein n=1 Tax=Panicum virgatum TaxID=38727 RepID=A0A8T0UUA5_PANVG|nr:hypothetical protein PVAP13_3KG123027 [Panicum virgatum]